METIITSVVSVLISIGVAHFYYSRASKDLSAEVNKLKGEVDELKAVSHNITESLEAVGIDTEKIKQHSVRGTPDDPDYPYK